MYKNGKIPESLNDFKNLGTDDIGLVFLVSSFVKSYFPIKKNKNDLIFHYYNYYISLLYFIIIYFIIIYFIIVFLLFFFLIPNNLLHWALRQGVKVQ